MKQRSLNASFNDALQGLLYVVRNERNMRNHIVIGLLVIILAATLSVTRLEMMVLILTIGGVFVAELINTALEETVNLVTKEYHPLAGVIKNIAAGAVLVAALTAAGIGYLIFVDYFLRLDRLVLRRATPLHYFLVLVLFVVVIVIIGWKALLGQDELLRGGMPSGHTAIAFALAMFIWEASRGLPVFAGFGLALLVAQSRLEGKIHNWWEILIGACVGIMIAWTFFQLRAYLGG